MPSRRIALATLVLTGALVSVTAAPAGAETPIPIGPQQTAPSTVSTQDDPAPAIPKPGAGTPVLKPNASGKRVRILQVRLQHVGVREAPTTGVLDQDTTAEVRAFQKLAGFVRTGVVDRATLDELTRRTGKVDANDLAAGADQPFGARLPVSCTVGHVICIDMRARSVRWVIDGVTKLRLDARFGAEGTPTRLGIFSITRKSRDHVSTLYGSKMPFALFFDRGQAVHYSSDFAARGYAGASHGCVNIRDFKNMEWLFDHAQVGDRVMVYRSRVTPA